MSDQTLDDGLDAAAEQAEAKPKSGNRRLIVFAGGGVALLLLLGGGAYLTGMLDGLVGKKKEPVAEAPAAKPAVFFDLPDLLVNLNGSGRKASFLKLTVSIELGTQDDVPRLQAVMPRIIDNFQVYLRELRVEDLRGSGGIYRLREELLSRVNAAAAPIKVNDVLFKEMLVQ
jgi:flagellar protein FliL